MPPGTRIGFDAIRALHNRTGLGNYARGVLRSLHRYQPSLDLHLYSPAAPRAEFAGLPSEVGATLHLPPAVAREPGVRALWRTVRAGRAAARDRIAIYHGLTHEIPRDLTGTGVRSVVSFHDLIYQRHPELFSWFDRRSYRWRYEWSARHADAIIAVSAHTRDDLIQCYGIEPARITVIPPPRDAAFATPVSGAERAAVRARYGLPAEYLLSVGTLETRKNHRVLVAALETLRGRGAPSLVLVGRDGGSANALRASIATHGLGDRVHLVSNLSSADLPAVMQGATLFLYPSLIEGFGMPIVEALSAGVPVIASSGGHLNDAGGPETRYVAPNQPEAWSTAIGELLGDGDATARIRTQGAAYATRFDAERVATALRQVYDQLRGA